MGIRFLCPNGHKLNVKAFQAGRRGICPFCGAKFQIPTESTLQPGQKTQGTDSPVAAATTSAASEIPTNSFEQNLEEHLQQVASGQVASDDSPAPVPWSDQPTQVNEPEQPSSGDEALVPVESQGVGDEPASPSGASASDGVSEDVPPVADGGSAESPPRPDPLAEASDAVWYVRPPSGGQFGPAQADMMRDWLREGRVSSETLVWREGWADWQEAGAIFPQLQSTATALPEAPPVATSNGDAGYRPGPRRRKNGPNIGLLAVLVAAVLLLLFALILILSRGADNGASERNNSVRISVADSCLGASFPAA